MLRSEEQRFILGLDFQSIFWFGAVLHIFSLLIIWTNIEVAVNCVNLIIASGISLLVSGYVYKILNSGISLEHRIRKCFGVQ